VPLTSLIVDAASGALLVEGSDHVIDFDAQDRSDRELRRSHVGLDWFRTPTVPPCGRDEWLRAGAPSMWRDWFCRWERRAGLVDSTVGS
jgi:hypothetical protein